MGFSVNRLFNPFFGFTCLFRVYCRPHKVNLCFKVLVVTGFRQIVARLVFEPIRARRQMTRVPLIWRLISPSNLALDKQLHVFKDRAN